MYKNICANAKLLYGVIIVLFYIRNYCFADNTYLVETLNTTRRTITRLIKELKDNDYIYIVNDKPKRELIEALIEKIVIDKDRNITIKFKYDIISQIDFVYVEENKVRNPYGRAGKNK